MHFNAFILFVSLTKDAFPPRLESKESSYLFCWKKNIGPVKGSAKKKQEKKTKILQTHNGGERSVYFVTVP